MDSDLIEDFKSKLVSICKKETESYDFKGCNIEARPNFQPLNTIIDAANCNEDPVILASAMLKDVDESLSTTKSSHREESIRMEGSPLKLQMFNSSRISTASSQIGSEIHPLNMNETRMLLSLYCLASMGCQVELMPLWIVCCGEEGDAKVVFMAAHIVTTNNGSRRVHTYKVTVQGPVQNVSTLPRLSSLIPTQISQTHTVQNKCYADYSILNTSTMNASYAGGIGTLSVKFSWDSALSLHQKPPSDSKACVCATVSPGDVRNAAHHMYQELTTLEGFVQGLRTGEIKWSLESNLDVVDQCKSIIQEIQLGDSTKKRSEVHAEESTDDSPVKHLFLGDRTDLDFTEQLWVILKTCKSSQELQSGFQCVLQSLYSGEVQPMVHKSNRSQLAGLVRESYYGRMVIPPLHGCKPLELLVEIGLEKMKRDYMNAFVGKDLVTANHLDSFVSKTGDLETQWRGLEKLHCTLELVVTLEQYLNLPRISLSVAANQALKYYENNKVNDDHVFTVPVQATDVINVADNLNPIRWKMEVHAKIDSEPIVDAFVLTTGSPFAHARDDILSNGDEKSEDPQYYLTLLTHDVAVI